MVQARTVLNTLLHEKAGKIGGGLYHKMQIDFAYNSNHMEGSRFTHEQTRYLFETHTIDGTAHVNDILETANHFRCFDYILDTAEQPLTESGIKHLHSLLKCGCMEESYDDAVIGDYKKYPNEVGGIATARPEDVCESMEALLRDFSRKSKLDLYDVAEFHAKFERIHPFYDGNGRIGRLLLLKMCLANDIVPFVIDDNNKIFYYKGLKEWQTEGKPERLLNVFLSAQDDMKCVLDYFKIVYDRAETSARELMRQHEKS